MPLLLWLNERSHPSGELHPVLGDNLMAGLVQLLRALHRQRQDSVLVSAVSVAAISLGSDLTAGQWGKRPERRDEWRWLRTLENRAPFSAAATPGSVFTEEIEYLMNEVRVEGLGAAHLQGGLAVSFASAALWDSAVLQLTRRMLEEGDDGEPVLRNEVVEVRHADRTEHAEVHRLWLRTIGLREPADGRDLWDRRLELLPNLALLPRVQAQLEELEPGHPWLRVSFERLRELSLAIDEWDPSASPVPDWLSKVTPEHASRRRLCWFPDLDGLDRCFDLHARMTPGCGRIHFRLEANPRKRAIVAHVGRKIE